MKKVSHKTILLLVVYTLVLNPVSMVFAGQFDGLLSYTTSTHCQMEDMVNKETMRMDHSSPSVKMADESECKCQMDCQQGACGISCTDCGHGFVAIITLENNTVQNHSELIHTPSSIQYQQSLLVHFRPPKALHS